MTITECPRCGSELKEDEREYIQEQEDSGIVIHIYSANVCQCGYMEQSEIIPEVIAQQGDDRLLLLYADDQARILDINDGVIWPPMHVESLLGRGYWDKYTGNYDVKFLLSKARDNRAAFLETPNLFQFATSELSQDAFLCWLISWSQKTYESIDRPLNKAAFLFVSEIFIRHKIPVPTIHTVTIKRQFKSLDILAIINDKYAILIEDKTYTKDHSNQLERYRESVQIAYPHLIQLPVYYKIADQSHYCSIENAGYIPFTRNMMLDILKKGKINGIKNDVYLDYLDHLQNLQDKIAAFRTKPVIDWDAYAWQGFYQELQREIKGDWGYVSNSAGGFWAFWWKSKHNQLYYLQLQEQTLCAKVVIEDKNMLKEFRLDKLKEILTESDMQRLSLRKPSRLRKGKTMTIAQRSDYIQMNEYGILDLDRTILELKKY
jgi:hypothetical protein